MKKTDQIKLANDLLGLHDADIKVFKERIILYLGLDEPQDSSVSSVSDDCKDSPSPEPINSYGDVMIPPELHLGGESPKRNKWDNLGLGGFVFLNLRAGIGGKEVLIAIGVQDRSSKEKGLKSVLPLTKDHISRIQMVGYLALTPAAASVLQRTDPGSYKLIKDHGLIS